MVLFVFRPKTKHNEWFARQYRHEHPPEFRLPLQFSGCMHHLSSPNSQDHGRSQVHMSKYSLSLRLLRTQTQRTQTHKNTDRWHSHHVCRIRSHKKIYIKIFKKYFLKLNICMIMYMSVSCFAHLFESFDLPQWLNVPFHSWYKCRHDKPHSGKNCINKKILIPPGSKTVTLQLLKK